MTIRAIYSVLALGFIITVSPLKGSAWAQAGQSAGSGTTAANSNAGSTLSIEYKAELDQARSALSDLKNARQGKAAAQQLATAKAYGDKALAVRARVLATVTTRLAASGCPSAQKEMVATSLALAQQTITAAQTELSNATTAEAARLTIKNAIEKTHVFAIFAPSVSGLCVSARLGEFLDNKLSPSLKKISAAGVDTTAVESQVAEIKSTLSEAETIFATLVKDPSISLSDGRAQLATARAKLVEVRTALSSLKTSLEGLLTSYENSSSSAPLETSTLK